MINEKICLEHAEACTIEAEHLEQFPKHLKQEKAVLLLRRSAALWNGAAVFISGKSEASIEELYERYKAEQGGGDPCLTCGEKR